MTSNQLGMTGEDGHFAITLTSEITRATGDAGKKPMRIVSQPCQNFTRLLGHGRVCPTHNTHWSIHPSIHARRLDDEVTSD